MLVIRVLAILVRAVLFSNSVFSNSGLQFLERLVPIVTQDIAQEIIAQEIVAQDEEKGFMGSLSAGRLVRVATRCGVTVGLFSILLGCGGQKPISRSALPAKVILNPGGSTSLQLGNTLHFSASAQNSANSSLNVTATFQSSDTSLLNFAPGGTACAGVWSTTFTVCVPGASGVVQVTAAADGVVSSPTLVFIHPPIDNIVLSQVPPSPPFANPVPCLSQNQTITMQATAYSQGIDVTASVGPFNFSAVSPSVVTISPIITNLTYNVVTNQAIATAAAPGFTQIFATASGVTSTPFQQYNSNWNFFETCPVQTIVLQLGPAGSQQSGITTFVANKGTPQTVSATVYDVLGNLMKKPPLTWSSTEPGAVSVSPTCTDLLTCTVTTAGAGAGIVTASCTPPSCNIGFPLIPANISPPSPYIPYPVYAATAISGVVNGAPTTTGVLGSSMDCAANFDCSVSLYNVSTATNVPGNPLALPTQPNSLLFDAAGDKAYVGSNFGVFTLSPASIGGANNPFGGLGTFTGKVLAVSNNGQLAAFSDTVHTPNQVFITNSSSSSSPAISNFSISGAVAAAFSPDNTKAFIVACVPGGVSCSSSTGNTIFVFSPLQSMQTIPLTAPASAVAFSSTGAFAFVTTASSVTTFNTCNNARSTDSASNPLLINLAAQPLFLRVLPPASAPPPLVNAGVASTGLDVLIALDNTGIDLIATSAVVLELTQPPSDILCPQFISLAQFSNPVITNPQHFNFGVGTFHPIAFFVSPDGTKAYVVTTDFSSVLVFDFNTGSLSGSIPLTGNAIPVSASFTEDGTLIYVAANDGTLHQVNTQSATDVQQISFPNLPNVNNAFCGFGSTTIDCNLDFVGVRP